METWQIVLVFIGVAVVVVPSLVAGYKAMAGRTAKMKSSSQDANAIQDAILLIRPYLDEATTDAMNVQVARGLWGKKPDPVAEAKPESPLFREFVAKVLAGVEANLGKQPEVPQ